MTAFTRRLCRYISHYYYPIAPRRPTQKYNRFKPDCEDDMDKKSFIQKKLAILKQDNQKGFASLCHYKGFPKSTWNSVNVHWL